MDTDKLEHLLAQATVDCYDEAEEFVGVLYALAGNLNFPLRATVLGELLDVTGLDDHQSSPRRGMIARVTKRGREYRIGLSELQFVNPDPVSAEWLAMYRYWLTR